VRRGCHDGRNGSHPLFSIEHRREKAKRHSLTSLTPRGGRRKSLSAEGEEKKRRRVSPGDSLGKGGKKEL